MDITEKVETYRVLESQTKNLMKQREMVINKMIEIKSTVLSLNEMEKSKGDILFPIGGEAWSSAKILDKDNVVVEVGAGIAMEKSFDEARDILEKRATELENAIEKIDEEISNASQQLNQLGPEIENEYNKMNAG